MVEEDLQDAYIDLLDEDEKKTIYENVVANLSKTRVERESTT